MSPELSKPLAYIVEDNDALSDIFSQALAMAGFEIRSAANGLQAIDDLATLAPQLIIVDLYLPGVSGDKILAHIHTEHHLEKSKIILTTFDYLLAEKFRDQCDFVLVKPVSFGQLRDLGIKLKNELNSGE
jgi:two-component system, sensor histidine kinase